MLSQLKSYLSDERKELKTEIPKPEYIAWWALRFAMIGMILFNVSRKREGMVIFIMSLNLLVTFIIPIIRTVFFKKIFLGNLPFRIQSFIDVFVFAGSFLGHGLDYNGTVPEYDKYMHFISGGITVFIGYKVFMSVKSGKDLPPFLMAAGSAGFSLGVAMLWELFEFFSDFFIPGSANQNWMYVPEKNILFFKIFGEGAQKTAQYTVFDTDLDLFYASTACLLCSIGLYIYLKLKEKRRINNDAEC